MQVKNWKDYLLQVSLIIVSLFIAFGVERCNERRKDNGKLEAYLGAIREELTDELESCRMNLADCENDIADLETGIVVFSTRNVDRLPVGIGQTALVFSRGVFRTFSPTTYELMTEAGDALLLEDLELRRQLASTVAFRNDYVKGDLQRHDALTLATLGEVSGYIDIECLKTSEPATFAACVTDTDQLWREGASDLTALLRQAELRAFHLELFEQRLLELIPLVEKKGR